MVSVSYTHLDVYKRQPINILKKITALLIISMSFSCGSDKEEYVSIDTYPNVIATFGNNINLSNLANYANQTVPSYIIKSNVGSNLITDKGATLELSLIHI